MPETWEETWKRMQRNEPDDEIVSKHESPAIYTFVFGSSRYMFFIIVAIGPLVIMLPLQIIVLIGLGDWRLPPLLLNSNMIDNYMYLKSVHLGLPLRYFTAIQLILGCMIASVVTLVVFYLWNWRAPLFKLNGFHLRSLLLRFLMALICGWIALWMNLRELHGGRYSSYGDVYINYLYLFTVSFCLAVVYTFICFLLPFTVKLIRYRGEFDDERP